MDNWITAMTEPKRLILAWQAPDHFGFRFRWAVGEVTATPTGELAFSYFASPRFEELNEGKSIEDARRVGYQGHPAFALEQQHHSHNVSDAFLRRLPPRTRSDFSKYVEHFRLRPDVSYSALTLLGRTEAKLPGDGFSLVDPLAPEDLEVDLMMEVAGFRHTVTDDRSWLQIGAQVEFVAEPTNPYDKNAVQIVTSGRHIGYVNRLQAPTIGSWLTTRRLYAAVERLNGKPDKPRVYLFVRVRPIASLAA